VYAPYKILGIKETWAAEIKLRAWRRLGEISRGLAKAHKAGKGSGVLQLPTVGSSKAEVLAQAGITTQDASRAETVAAIEEDVFEQYAAKKKAQGQPVYEEKAIKNMTGKRLLATPMR